MLADRLHEGADPLDRHGDVELGTGQQAAGVTDAAAQVDPIQHACESRRPGRRRPAPPARRDGEPSHAGRRAAGRPAGAAPPGPAGAAGRDGPRRDGAGGLGSIP